MLPAGYFGRKIGKEFPMEHDRRTSGANHRLDLQFMAIRDGLDALENALQGEGR